MNYRNKITITGDLGSGKSSLANILAKELNFNYLSVGKVQRKIAKEMNMDTLELNLYSESHPDIDKKIDSVFIELNENPEGYVVDSRLAWFFIKTSLKIYLEVPTSIAADRVLSDVKRTDEPDYKNKHQAINDLISRRSSEERRFLTQYGVLCSNMNNYDCVINSSFVSVQEIKDLVIKLFTQWKKIEPINVYWVSPKLLFPSEGKRIVASESSIALKKNIAENGFMDEFPVEVVKKDDFYFIWDGHKRTSAAIFNNLPLIPVLVLAKDQEEICKGHSVDQFVKSSLNLKSYREWEDFHNFQYTIYPNMEGLLAK